MKEQQMDYQLEVPASPLMQMKAENIVGELLNDHSSYSNLGELIALLIYMRDACDEALNAIAGNLPKEAFENAEKR